MPPTKYKIHNYITQLVTTHNLKNKSIIKHS